jgi:8-oxo-dGTP pyrophosphatase MutT (NUDIX family)
MLDFISRLEQRLSQDLPGLDTQMRMSPPIRGKDVVIPDNVRSGCVLVFVYPHEGKWHLSLMKRAEDGSTHSGQISFPGGTVEESDENHTFTALREAEEEVGIPKEKVTVLGKLTELYIPPSNFLVYPTVAYMAHRPDFVADPKEVAAIVEVPLSHLLQEEIVAIKKVKMSGRTDLTFDVPTYTIQGHTIWGATAMMLCEFLEIVKAAKP